MPQATAKFWASSGISWHIHIVGANFRTHNELFIASLVWNPHRFRKWIAYFCSAYIAAIYHAINVTDTFHRDENSRRHTQTYHCAKPLCLNPISAFCLWNRKPISGARSICRLGCNSAPVKPGSIHVREWSLNHVIMALTWYKPLPGWPARADISCHLPNRQIGGRFPQASDVFPDQMDMIDEIVLNQEELAR